MSHACVRLISALLTWYNTSFSSTRSLTSHRNTHVRGHTLCFSAAVTSSWSVSALCLIDCLSVASGFYRSDCSPVFEYHICVDLEGLISLTEWWKEWRSITVTVEYVLRIQGFSLTIRSLTLFVPSVGGAALCLSESLSL